MMGYEEVEMSVKKLEKMVRTDTNDLKGSIAEGSKKSAYMNKKMKIATTLIMIAIFLVALVAVIGANQSFSQCVSDESAGTAMAGKIISVFTGKRLTLDEETFGADIEIPFIEGLENKELENSLNEQYLAEGEKLYEDFVAEIEEIKAQGMEAHLGISSGYIIKTDTDKILSIERYVVNVAASSSTVTKYDNIDKEKEILLTLPGLFKNEDYIDVISENIKKQMLEQVRLDEGLHYWVEGIEESDFFGLFEKIFKEQKFYINENYKLVIVFDKYEVAPGYMGVVEFEIPTNIISDLLISDEYIK